MNTHKGSEVSLPVGENQGWDKASNGGEGDISLNSVFDSGVLAHSLRQSRNKWLYHMFPKFMTKARGSKATDPALPPPHTLYRRGRCDVVIGPHLFPETNFYEAHYQPPQAQHGSHGSHPQPLLSPSSTPWQSAQRSGVGLHVASSAAQIPNQGATQPATSSIVPTMGHSIPSLPPDSELVNQVKIAALTNPTLAHLLQLTTAGKATPDQLRTLGLLVKSMHSPSNPLMAPTAMKYQAQSATIATLTAPIHPVKEFDLVIEFKDAPSEQLLVPRGPCIFEWQGAKDATLTLRLPFDKPAITLPDAQPIPSQEKEEDTRQAISLLIKEVQPGVSDTLTRWIGGEEKIKEYRDTLNALGKPTRVYLGYQLPSGPLLTQLKLLAQPYPMKLLKHGPIVQRPPRPKRTVPPKSKVEPEATPSLPAPISKGRSSAPKAPKRQKTAHTPSTEIACLVCKKKDVPLILGGRFCRPCVESGRAGKDPSYHVAPYPRPYMINQPPVASPPVAPSSLIPQTKPAQN